MSHNLKRGETVNLSQLVHKHTMARIESRPIETTRDALKRNDTIALYNAILVFGVKR